MELYDVHSNVHVQPTRYRPHNGHKKSIFVISIIYKPFDQTMGSHTQWLTEQTAENEEASAKEKNSLIGEELTMILITFLSEKCILSYIYFHVHVSVGMSM